jgi:hypothetical protein
VNCKKIFKKGITFIIIFLLIGISTFQSTGKSILNQQNNNQDTIYYAEALIEYSKSKTENYFRIGRHINFVSGSVYRSFDANMDELVLKIIVNYTAEMNFTAGYPFVIFAPIIAFGMKIENYTDYVWKSFKLKHDGYAKREGNISIEIPFDMDTIEKGDKFLLDPTVAIVGDPLVYKSKDLQFNRFTSILLRFAYHTSSLKNNLLEYLILPFIAEYSDSGIYGDSTRIYIHFI